eukprot:scaffold183906_cov25-Tisochrysis_lutea.AAC.2
MPLSGHRTVEVAPLSARAHATIQRLRHQLAVLGPALPPHTQRMLPAWHKCSLRNHARRTTRPRTSYRHNGMAELTSGRARGSPPRMTSAQPRSCVSWCCWRASAASARASSRARSSSSTRASARRAAAACASASPRNARRAASALASCAARVRRSAAAPIAAALRRDREALCAAARALASLTCAWHAESAARSVRTSDSAAPRRASSNRQESHMIVPAATSTSCVLGSERRASAPVLD